MQKNQQKIQLLSERETAKRLGLTRQQFIDLQEANVDFPVEVNLSDQASGWVEHEIDDYLDLRIWHRDRRIAAWELATSKKERPPSQRVAAVSGAQSAYHQKTTKSTGANA